MITVEPSKCDDVQFDDGADVKFTLPSGFYVRISMYGDKLTLHTNGHLIVAPRVSNEIDVKVVQP